MEDYRNIDEDSVPIPDTKMVPVGSRRSPASSAPRTSPGQSVTPKKRTHHRHHQRASTTQVNDWSSDDECIRQERPRSRHVATPPLPEHSVANTLPWPQHSEMAYRSAERGRGQLVMERLNARNTGYQKVQASQSSVSSEFTSKSKGVSGQQNEELPKSIGRGRALLMQLETADKAKHTDTTSMFKSHLSEPFPHPRVSSRGVVQPEKAPLQESLNTLARESRRPMTSEESRPPQLLWSPVSSSGDAQAAMSQKSPNTQARESRPPKTLEELEPSQSPVRSRGVSQPEKTPSTESLNMLARESRRPKTSEKLWPPQSSVRSRGVSQPAKAPSPESLNMQARESRRPKTSEKLWPPQSSVGSRGVSQPEKTPSPESLNTLARESRRPKTSEKLWPSQSPVTSRGVSQPEKTPSPESLNTLARESRRPKTLKESIPSRPFQSPVSSRGDGQPEKAPSQESLDTLAMESRRLRTVEELRPPRPSHRPAVSIEHLTKMAVRPIFVVGECKPKPLSGVDDADLHDFVLQRLHSLKLLPINYLQADVWAATKRSRSLVAITPLSERNSVTYLIPTLSSLLRENLYADVPAGHEPLAIVFCATWESVLRVYNTCNSILDNDNRLRISYAYGGGFDQSKKIYELTECDMLFITPCSFVRLMQNNVVNMRRMCHLIVDDAEIITDEFAEEMMTILTHYKAVLAKRREQKIQGLMPLNTMVFGTRWTVPMQSFVENTMQSPLLYFSNIIEAVVYSKLDVDVISVRIGEKDQKLIELLEPNIEACNRKIIVVACDDDSGQKLYAKLSTLSKRVLFAHGKLNIFDVSAIGASWMEHFAEGADRPILIVVDKVLRELQIDDVDLLIHYDVPTESKSEFAQRFCLMMKHMAENRGTRTNCQSLILLDETCNTQARALCILLQRLKDECPKNLLAFAAGHYDARERRKRSEPFCDYVETFGHCMRPYVCTARHILSKKMDNPFDIPRGARVHIKITGIHSASHFYCQILKYEREPGKYEQMLPAYICTPIDLTQYFASRKKQYLQSTPRAGELCAIKSIDGSCQRIRILDVMDEQSGDLKVVELDTGILYGANSSYVFRLPTKFRERRPKAFEVFLCNIRPIDRDLLWTERAYHRIDQLIRDQELTGQVELMLGNKMWLNPLAKYNKLETSNDYVFEFDVSKVLLSKKFAMENSVHLSNLFKAYEQKFGALPPTMLKPVKQEPLKKPELPREDKVNYAFLPQTQFESVILSSVHSPSLFYVRKLNSADLLEFLMTELEKYKSENPKPVVQVLPGMICVAVFPIDNDFYRARVLEVSEKPEGTVIKVFYMDYGDIAHVKPSDIFPLPEKYIWRVQMQAIECGLDGIEPVGGGEIWSDEVADYLWSLRDGQNDPDDVQGGEKVFVIWPMKTLTRSTYGGGNRYEVSLFDMTDEDNEINIAMELCCSRRAVQRSLGKDEPENSSETAGNVVSPDDGLNDVSDLDADKAANKDGNSDIDVSPDVANETNDSDLNALDVPLEVHDTDAVNVPDKPEDILPTIQPAVLWSETSEAVCFKVKIETRQQPSIVVEQHRLHFRANLEDQIAEFFLELYDEVDETDYKVTVELTCVLVTLNKKRRCKWTRLLKDKIKFPWLSVDFDKVDCSDDDSPSESFPWPRKDDDDVKKFLQPSHNGVPDIRMPGDNDSSPDEDSCSSSSTNSLIEKEDDPFDFKL